MTPKKIISMAPIDMTHFAEFYGYKYWNENTKNGKMLGPDFVLEG